MELYSSLLGPMLYLLVAAILDHRPVDAEVDEGHTENGYFECINEEDRKHPNVLGVEFNAEVVEYGCLENLLYSVTTSPNLDLVQKSWLKNLYTKFGEEVTLAQRGQLPIRQRKEYRMLSAEELHRFNRAVVSFKQDRTRVFQAFTSLHVGSTSRSAHRGPGFLVWNRIFLTLFELALREYESDVTLPYWDCTLDQQLERPTQSLIWTDQFAGNGNGRVVTGPFVNWNLEGRDLIRNTGEAGQLINPAAIANILTGQKLMKDITFPIAHSRDNLELHSYGVRLWVGGDMALLETATNDPMYFLLHAYIDNIWQQFRNNEENFNIDPQRDYPTRFLGYFAHFPNASLGVVPDLTNRQGLGDQYGKLVYTYVPPLCSPDGISCGTSGALRCNSASNQCRAVARKQSVGSSCEGSSGYQNSYCIDGNCDERDWIYLPLEVVYLRPRDLTFPNRPFTSPSIQSEHDVYSPERFTLTSNGTYLTALQESARPLTYQRDDCRCTSFDTGRVYVQSYGLNYNGVYREYSPSDKRLPVSSVWVNIAMKDPRDSADFQSRAIVRAYDDCGRVCKIYCRAIGTTSYTQCSGTVIVSTEEPKQYAETMEEAYYLMWDYASNARFPTHKRDLSFLKAYCDDGGEWPWLGYSYIQDPYKPLPPIPNEIDFEDLLTTTTTTTPAPTTTSEPTTTVTTQPPTTVLVPPESCLNETVCFLNYEPENCTRCDHNTFSYCWEDCTLFLHCSKAGVWYIKECPSGLLWDDSLKTCNFAFYVECRSGARCPWCKEPRATNQRPGRTRG